MDLNDYLVPYKLKLKNQANGPEKMSSFVDFFDSSQNPTLDSYEVFILGVPEGRNTIGNQECYLAPDEIRNSFYSLFSRDWTLSVVDLGNLKVGETFHDTYIALTEISAYFISLNKVLIILGGGHDLIVPVFKGHSFFNEPLNFASVDAYLDFQDEGATHSKSFLSSLLSYPNSLLAQYSLFGYQSYLCSQKEIELLNQMNFNMLRLGSLNDNIREIEPDIRTLNHISIDLCSLKISESPGNPYSGPNGISSELICSIMRYAGMSLSVKSVLLSELNPIIDSQSQSARIYAQSLWYFLLGFEFRSNDSLFLEKDNYLIYHVTSSLTELVFYRSKLSNRWWVNIPGDIKLNDSQFFPCSFLDYQNALDGILSDRVLKYLKL